jgi:glycerophosphoryl diester phosphodiesterase
MLSGSDPPPMTATPTHPVFAHLRSLASAGPVVVAHRGDSRRQPENTLAAFRAAAALGVAMQEFDVQSTRDGELVCLHDASLDRTSDAATTLGPGALVAHTDLAVVQRLDAGRWFAAANADERIPTLASALATMLPGCIPLIEHKGGAAERFARALSTEQLQAHCIVQSFDWAFVATMGRWMPGLARAVLGPTDAFARCDARTIDAALAVGAGMVHWQDHALRRADVERAHAAGLLVCSYTTDDELGWEGGKAMHIDAMCTNDPLAMLHWRQVACRPQQRSTL